MSTNITPDLSRDSRKIYQTVLEMWHVWKALKQEYPDRDHFSYMQRKYSKFVKDRVGTQLFYQIKYNIDNRIEYDFNKLHSMLLYKDKIDQGKISNEDASAHFEYSMHKQHTFDKYDEDHKQKMEEEYNRRFEGKSDDVKKNLFFDAESRPKPVEVEVKIRKAPEPEPEQHN